MDPEAERRDAKMHKEHSDMLGYVADAQYGIPKKCVCGGVIINEVVGETEYDKLPERRFFTCLNYEDNGLHYRHPWAVAIQEEFEKMSKRVEEAEEVIKGVYTINKQIEFLEEQVKTLTEEVYHLTLQLTDLERVCFE